MSTLEVAKALSPLIGSQTDQLWSAAMAVIVAEIYIACRFFSQIGGNVRWLPTGLLMATSIVCHLVSLGSGYLTKGALIEMTRTAAKGGDFAEAYANAALTSLVQFGSLALGLILFIIVFGLDFSGIARIIGRQE